MPAETFPMRTAPAAALAAITCLASAAHAAPPPASAFGRIPTIDDAAISPDGRRVAILGGLSDQRVVSIATIDDPNLPVLPMGDAEAVGLSWVGDDHVLARLAYWEKAGPRLAYRFERNVSIDASARAVARLLDGDEASRYLIEQPLLGATVGPPARAYVMGMAFVQGSGSLDTRIKRKGQDSIVPALWKVDPATGKGVIVEKGDADTWGWALNANGEARLRLEVDEITQRFSILARGKGSGQWTPFWQGADFESRRRYLGYSAPEDAIYLADGDQIVRKRISDGVVEAVGQPLGGYSPAIRWDTRRLAPAAIETGAEKPVSQWLDPELGGVHAALSKIFKDQRVILYEWSSDRTRFVVRVNSPSAAPIWYLFDRTRKELSPLGEEYPELKGVALGKTNWITYKARDGLEIPAYLTLPPGAPAGSRPPLIVLPHGGPAARDAYGFDYIVQYLATRGYAVLQPQFRGSWGFGDAFEKAGAGEWGGKMQTDLLDGIAAVAGQADASRVCIVGASFGGYAALAGATLSPDAYRCAASIAGISDLGLLISEERRVYGKDSGAMQELTAMLGAASKGKLAATSPARLAASVKVPILLIHGDKDTIVPPEQSEVMAQALKAAGKTVDYVMLQNENHYLTRAATRTQALESIGAFLARNLPVGN